MSWGSRLGLAGLIVALGGIAAFYLWPDRKWIGWFCLIFAVLLVLAWMYLELSALRLNGNAVFIWAVIVMLSVGLMLNSTGSESSSSLPPSVFSSKNERPFTYTNSKM